MPKYLGYLGNEELTPHTHKPSNTQLHGKNTCMQQQQHPKNTHMQRQQQQQRHTYAKTITMKKEYQHLGLPLAIASHPDGSDQACHDTWSGPQDP